MSVDFPARALAAVAIAALIHFSAATLFLSFLLEVPLPGQRAALSLSVLLTTLSGVAALYVRAQYASAQHVARAVPRVFVYGPPLWALGALALTLPTELLHAPPRWWLHAANPVVVASWVPALLVALVMAPLLERLAAKAPADETLVTLRTVDPPTLGMAFGRILVTSGTAVALLGMANASIEPEVPFPALSSTLAWTGIVALLAIACVVGLSLGQTPGEDLMSIAHRLDALGYGSRHDGLDTPVLATSPDEVGELFARLDDLRARLADEMHLYEQALEKTSHADNLKAEFLNAVSHELRTPLNAIGGFAQLLLEGNPQPPNDAQAEDLQLIQAGARQLLGLINDILDISMIESGELRLTYGPTDVAATIAEVVRIHQPQVRGRPVRLYAELEPELPLVVCDPRRLTQILTNLVSNATKFTEAGTITVRANYDARNNAVAVRCVDTGIGIEKGDLTQIFEEYRQAGSTKRRTNGTGLGLAIARRIAQAHGGSLNVESVLGEGSTFTLLLPLDPPNRPATIDMVEEVARYRAEASAQAKVLTEETQ